jgi:IS5 family transposase
LKGTSATTITTTKRKKMKKKKKTSGLNKKSESLLAVTKLKRHSKCELPQLNENKNLESRAYLAVRTTTLDTNGQRSNPKPTCINQG